MLEIDITWMVQELKISRPKSVVICLLFMLILSIPCALSFGVLADTKLFGKNSFRFSRLLSSLTLPFRRRHYFRHLSCLVCLGQSTYSMADQRRLSGMEEMVTYSYRSLLSCFSAGYYDRRLNLVNLRHNRF